MCNIFDEQDRYTEEGNTIWSEFFETLQPLYKKYSSKYRGRDLCFVTNEVIEFIRLVEQISNNQRRRPLSTKDVNVFNN